MTDGLEERLDALEQRLDGMQGFVQGTDDEVEQLRSENESLHQEVRELRTELREVKQFTDLLSPGEDVSKSKETRAALALRTLWNTASNSNGVATLDAAGVADANQGEIGRSYAHEVMKVVPDLVGDERVCWRIEEDRHAPENTRVVLDLRDRNDAASTVPSTAEDVPIRGGTTADD